MPKKEKHLNKYLGKITEQERDFLFIPQYSLKH